MEYVLACDEGGPIQPGDSLHYMGPYVTRWNEEKSEPRETLIALEPANFIDYPVAMILIATSPLEGDEEDVLLPNLEPFV